MTLPSALSFGLLILTLIERELTARRLWWAPIAGLLIQLPWLAFSIWQELWGIAALSVILGVIYARAIPKWRGERKGTEDGETTD